MYEKLSNSGLSRCRQVKCATAGLHLIGWRGTLASSSLGQSLPPRAVERETGVQVMHYIRVSLGALFGLTFSIVAAASAAEEVEFSAEGWKRVQEALVWHGHQLVPNGVAGPTTRAALRSWQAKTGYPRTGELTADQYYDMIRTMPTARLQQYLHPPGACWSGRGETRGPIYDLRYEEKERLEWLMNRLTSEIRHHWPQRVLDLPLSEWCEDGRLLKVTPTANYLVEIMFDFGYSEPLKAFMERGGNINHRVRIVDYSEDGQKFEEFPAPLAELMTSVYSELFMEDYRPSIDQAHSLQRRAYPVIDLLLENGADPNAKNTFFMYNPEAPSILQHLTDELTDGPKSAAVGELFFGIAERLVKYGATCLYGQCQDALEAYREAH